MNAEAIAAGVKRPVQADPPAKVAPHFFSKHYDHQSPYRWLLRLKMNRAAEWLQQPGSLVKQVSERVGFRDPFHFSRMFKSVFGLPPEAFRRPR